MAGDIRGRFKHWGTWLITIALEIGATLMAVRAAWLMVATLFVGGLITLALGYWPEVRTFLVRRLASGSPGVPGRIEYLETSESGELRSHMPPDVRRKFTYIVAAAVVALAAIIGAGFFFEHRTKPKQQHPDIPVASRLDNTMQLACAYASPDVIATGKPFVEFRAELVRGKDAFSVGTATETVAKDSPEPLQCQLYNFRQEAAVNIVTVVQLVLRKFRTVDLALASRPDATAGQIQEVGPPIRAAAMTSPYENIGPNSSFTFFVRNFAADAALQVSLPSWVLGEAIGEAKWGRIKLIPTSQNNFALGAWKPQEKTFIYSDVLYPKSLTGKARPKGKWTTLPTPQMQCAITGSSVTGNVTQNCSKTVVH